MPKRRLYVNAKPEGGRHVHEEAEHHYHREDGDDPLLGEVEDGPSDAGK